MGKPHHKEADVLICFGSHHDHTDPHIDRKLDQIMATLDGLTAAVDQMTTDVAEAIAELQRLGQIIRDGGTVSQEDIDALTDKLASAGGALDAAVAEDETPV